MKKVTILVPEDLHRAVKAATASRGDTMTRIVVDAFQNYLGEDDEWARWKVLLEQARQLTMAQEARQGVAPGADIDALIAEGRSEPEREIEDAIAGR